MFANTFYLIGASIIGIFGAYLAEKNHRFDFLLRLSVDQERARSESLLLNVLPQSVAERLNAGRKSPITLNSASVLFADIVNFTPLSAGFTPIELVGLLNKVFTHSMGWRRNMG